MMPARAELGLYVVIGLIWAVAQIVEKVQARNKAQRPAPSRPPAPALPESERARGAQTTQEEAEELARWLRERLGGTVLEPPTPIRTPMPAPRPKPQAGPLGRPADVPLESADEEEERASLDVERDVVSYDEMVVRHEAPVLVDLDDESAFAAERRRREADRQERPRARDAHAAFHRKIEAPAPTPSDVEVRQNRRRRALRQALIASEVLAPPVSVRRTS